jgi:hypothetical protein
MIGQATVGGRKKPITKVASGFAGQAPLWTYILAEAQVTSWRHADPGPADDYTPIRLGPVGGRLIAEVFAALLLGDPTSYLRAETAFVPIPEFTHMEVPGSNLAPAGAAESAKPQAQILAGITQGGGRSRRSRGRTWR